MDPSPDRSFSDAIRELVRRGRVSAFPILLALMPGGFLQIDLG
jgi:hypothetical protein